MFGLTAVSLLAGCAPPEATYQQAFDLAGMSFEFHTAQTGVHPHTDVMRDPNNPFKGGLGGDTNEDGAPGDGKWAVESTGLAVPRFYAWATILVQQPTGEHQYFASAALRDIFDTAQAAPDDLYRVRTAAIDGYQVVLDEFTDALSYTADGAAYPLAPLALGDMLGLGATPEGWWPIEVTADDADAGESTTTVIAYTNGEKVVVHD